MIEWPVGGPAPKSPIFEKIMEDFGKFVGRLMEPVVKARKAHNTKEMQAIYQTYLHKYGNKTFYDALIEGLKEQGSTWTKDEIRAIA